MKRWGRKTGMLLLSVALLLVVGLTGCPAPVNEIELTPAELVAKVVEAYEGIETFQYEMSKAMHIGGWGMTGISTRIGVFDLLNERMRMTATMQTHAPQAIKQCQPPVQKVVCHREKVMYFVDGRLYTLHMMPDCRVWIEEEMRWDFFQPVPVDQLVPVVLQRAVWKEMCWDRQPVPVDQFVQLLKASEVELQGTEVVRGIDSFVVSLVPDMEKLWEIAARKRGTPPQVMQRGEFREVSITQWICKDTFLPVREYMRWTWEYDWTTTTKATTYYHSFNEPVSIVLPPEAADAVRRRPPPPTIEDVKELYPELFEFLEECPFLDDDALVPPPPPALTIQDFKDIVDIVGAILEEIQAIGECDPAIEEFKYLVEAIYKELEAIEAADAVKPPPALTIQDFKDIVEAIYKELELQSLELEVIKEFLRPFFSLHCHDDALKVPPPPP